MKYTSKFILIPLVLMSSCNKEEDTQSPIALKREICYTDQLASIIAKGIDPWVEYDYNQTKIYPKVHRNIGLVFNILETPKTKKITDDQIKKQVASLNQNFKGEDPDITPNLPLPFIKFSMFEPSGISFFVKKINRKATKIKIWDAPSREFKFSEGIMGANGNHYLNVWVLDGLTDEKNVAEDKILTGFAIYPGVDTSSNKAEYGATVTRDLFFYEKESTITGKNHRRSKTLTHEIAHALGLFHMTGVDKKSNEVICGDDRVADTPTQANFHFDYLKYPVYDNCHGQNFIQMYMNYMDYTPEDVRYFFTNGQINRMRYFFQKGKYNAELGTKK